MGCGLDEEFVAPRVECFKGFGVVDVVAETAAVGTAVECNAERLEALLTRSVPQLHGDESVVDHDLASEEVGTDRGFVRRREALVDICEGRVRKLISVRNWKYRTRR